MTDRKRAFRDALGWFTTGVAVITAQADNEPPIGITVNSFSSVSLDPPLVLWCLDKGSDTFETFERADHFAVNVLHRGHQDLSNRLAKKGDHALEGLEVAVGDSGCPRLSDILAHFECKIVARHDAGDHVIFVGEVLDFSAAEEGEPLLYHRGRYHELLPGER